MRANRLLLLFVSTLIVLFLLGGGLVVKVGAAENSYRQAVLFAEVLSLVLENYVDPVEADGFSRSSLPMAPGRTSYLSAPADHLDSSDGLHQVAVGGVAGSDEAEDGVEGAGLDPAFHGLMVGDLLFTGKDRNWNH